MIRSFHDRDTEKVYRGIGVRRFSAFENVAIRRLFQLDAATSLRDLRGPGLQLEKLTDNRAGQYSVRINKQWRVCFVRESCHATHVEITDYH